MRELPNKYCLDTNVLIEAWQKYYNPKFCPDYWRVLKELGNQDKIFIPESVFEEIIITEDDLSNWLKESNIPIAKTSNSVIMCLKEIYAADPEHKKLVDNIKGRSLADPWVIAHAMETNSTVVTKEIKETALNSKRIRIPNVCENMGIRWINDFQFINELDIKFKCAIP